MTDWRYEWHDCPRCHDERVRPGMEICSGCEYEAKVAWMMEFDPDDQDWEFAHCECCGSTLSPRGKCHNTSCGCSPDVGKYWV